MAGQVVFVQVPQSRLALIELAEVLLQDQKASPAARKPLLEVIL